MPIIDGIFKVTLCPFGGGVIEGVNGLVELIHNIPGKRTPYFAKVLNTSSKNIERWLQQLKMEGKVEFRGAPKAGGYFPIGKTKAQ